MQVCYNFFLLFIDKSKIHFNVNKRLMNKLEPGSIPKYTTRGAGFKLRENISLFRK